MVYGLITGGSYLANLTVLVRAIDIYRPRSQIRDSNIVGSAHRPSRVGEFEGEYTRFTVSIRATIGNRKMLEYGFAMY